LQSRVWEPAGQALLQQIDAGEVHRALDIGCGAMGWLRVLAAQLLASKQFARRVVIERWFLHMHDPALPAALVSPEEITAAP